MCGVRLPKLVTDSVRGTEKCLSGVTLELVVTDSTKVTEARLSAESTVRPRPVRHQSVIVSAKTELTGCFSRRFGRVLTVCAVVRKNWTLHLTSKTVQNTDSGQAPEAIR